MNVGGGAATIAFALLGGCKGGALAPVIAPDPKTVTVAPGSVPRIATVDERYESYNMEMAERGRREDRLVVRDRPRCPRFVGCTDPGPGEASHRLYESGGGSISAAELFNEPTIAAAGGAAR